MNQCQERKSSYIIIKVQRNCIHQWMRDKNTALQLVRLTQRTVTWTIMVSIRYLDGRAQTQAGDFSMLTARWAGQRLERANAPPCWHLGLPITSEHAMIRTIILWDPTLTADGILKDFSPTKYHDKCLALLLADRLNFILVTNHVLQNPWSENWLSVGFSGFLKFSSNFKSSVHRE